MRGCGVPPKTLTGKVWDAEHWLVNEIEHLHAMPDGNRASQQYTWANIGDSLLNAGSLWPWCPAWFARFYDGPENMRADTVIELAGYVRKKMLPLVMSGPISVTDSIEVARVINIMDMLNNESQARQIQETKTKTGRR